MLQYCSTWRGSTVIPIAWYINFSQFRRTGTRRLPIASKASAERGWPAMFTIINDGMLSEWDDASQPRTPGLDSSHEQEAAREDWRWRITKLYIRIPLMTFSRIPNFLQMTLGASRHPAPPREVGTVNCAVNSIYTLYSVECRVYIIQYAVYSVYYTLYSVECTLYIIQCWVYITHYTLYTIHCRVSLQAPLVTLKLLPPIFLFHLVQSFRFFFENFFYLFFYVG